jgi:ribosomal protein L31
VKTGVYDYRRHTHPAYTGERTLVKKY